MLVRRIVSSRKHHAQFRLKGPTDPHAREKEAKDKPQKSPETRRKYIWNYIHWLWPKRVLLVGILGLSVLTAVLDLLWPLAIKWVMDMLGSAESAADKSRKLALYGIGIIVLLLSKQAFDTVREYGKVILNSQLLVRLRNRLYERLLSLSLSQLSDMKTGGIVSRLSGDVDSVSGLVNLAFINPAVAGLRVVVTITIIFALSWQLALTSILLLPPLAAVSFLWMRKVRPIYRSMREDRSTIDARVTESFGGIRVVRAFRREPREQHAYALGHHTVMRKGLYAEWLEMALGTIWGLLIPGISVLIIWFGGHLYLQGKATIGDLFAFQIYAVLLIQPVWQIVSSVSQTQRSLAAMERVFEVLETEPDKPDAPDAIDAPETVTEIRFRGVGFEYRAGIAVLKDFDLSVRGGMTVALVGPSGAGKTTVTDLVARFYDPTFGSITLNGIDLRKLKLQSYRHLLAVVQQEVFLFDGTVRENISYGKRGVSDAQVIHAATRANAHEFIDRLPEGYDTLIGERGFKLSGGQRQRLSIARAILANPRILILDEATSNLDTESEQLIQSSLRELLSGRTTFVIAHRLSTITHADLIVAMDRGEIVETGTHEELMNKQGFYFDMVQRQRKSFEQDGSAVFADESR